MTTDPVGGGISSESNLHNHIADNILSLLGLLLVTSVLMIFHLDASVAWWLRQDGSTVVVTPLEESSNATTHTSATAELSGGSALSMGSRVHEIGVQSDLSVNLQGVDPSDDQKFGESVILEPDSEGTGGGTSASEVDMSDPMVNGEWDGEIQRYNKWRRVLEGSGEAIFDWHTPLEGEKFGEVAHGYFEVALKERREFLEVIGTAKRDFELQLRDCEPRWRKEYRARRYMYRILDELNAEEGWEKYAWDSDTRRKFRGTERKVREDGWDFEPEGESGNNVHGDQDVKGNVDGGGGAHEVEEKSQDWTSFGWGADNDGGWGNNGGNVGCEREKEQNTGWDDQGLSGWGDRGEYKGGEGWEDEDKSVASDMHTTPAPIAHSEALLGARGVHTLGDVSAHKLQRKRVSFGRGLVWYHVKGESFGDEDLRLFRHNYSNPGDFYTVNWEESVNGEEEESESESVLEEEMVWDFDRETVDRVIAEKKAIKMASKGKLKDYKWDDIAVLDNEGYKPNRNWVLWLQTLFWCVTCLPETEWAWTEGLKIWKCCKENLCLVVGREPMEMVANFAVKGVKFTWLTWKQVIKYGSCVVYGNKCCRRCLNYSVNCEESFGLVSALESDEESVDGDSSESFGEIFWDWVLSKNFDEISKLYFKECALVNMPELDYHKTTAVNMCKGGAVVMVAASKDALEFNGQMLQWKKLRKRHRCLFIQDQPCSPSCLNAEYCCSVPCCDAATAKAELGGTRAVQ